MSLSLPDGITEIALAEGYSALQIKTPACQATLALHGAHLTHWQPSHTRQPVLYTSPTTHYREGKAIRGGVPLCWPWFNAHPIDPQKYPSHGVARNRFWTLESATIDGTTAKIILTLPATPEIKEHVPFAYHLRAIFTLGETCVITLETTNQSEENIPVGGALHTYLALSQIDHINLAGLQNTPYLDTTAEPEAHQVQQEALLAITGEVDRIYFGTQNPIQLHDPTWKRTITVSKEESLSTVVWNPWLEKATALGDLPDQAYQDFVCIEASNARQDTRILAPGETHALTSQLKVLTTES